MTITNSPILLYIDPGTGSMLFSVILGLFTALFFCSQELWIKLKSSILGGRAKKISRNKVDVIVFSDSKRYWNTFEPICDELDRRGLITEYWTESEDDPAFSHTYNNVKCCYIGNINKAITKLNIMNAYICLSTTPGLEVYQWKKSRNTDCYIHIFHSVSSGVTYRMFGLDFYDEIMLPGDFVEENIRNIEHLRNLPTKKMIKIGLPYLDSLSKDISERSFSKSPDITVLLAPTWGVNSLFNQMGDELISALIDTGYNIIIRPHPQSYTAEGDLITRLMDKFPESPHLHWNNDNDNTDVLGCSDIIISDYSGVLYDFALVFDKPVIYSLPHFIKDPYDAWFLSYDPKLISILPEMAVELTRDKLRDIKSIIDKAINDEAQATTRSWVRDNFWYNHGSSAKMCVDYIEGKITTMKDKDNTLSIEKVG